MTIETDPEKTPDAFKRTVSILITVTAIVGAILTWRIFVTNGAAGSADAKGLAAALQSSNTSIAISTYLSNNLNFFVAYRRHFEAAGLLDRQAKAAEDPARRTALSEEAVREWNLAAVARNYLDFDYLERDPADHSEIFNGNRYWDAQWAYERTQKDLDETPFFEKADRLRRRAQDLVATTVVLGLALLLFVVSTHIAKRPKFVLAGAGGFCLLAAAAAAVVIQLAR